MSESDNVSAFIPSSSGAISAPLTAPKASQASQSQDFRAEGALPSLLRTWKPLVRDTAAELLHRVGLTRPALFARNRLSIVTFHRVLPAEQLAAYPVPEIAVTPEELDFLLTLFGQHYRVGTLAQSISRFDEKTSDDRPLLAVTFDDGQRDNLLHAAPVLEAHDMRASFFVVTEAIEQNSTLWHDRIAYAMTALLARDAERARALLAEIDVAFTHSDLANAAVARCKLLPPVRRDAWVAALEASVGGAARPEWDGMLTWDELRAMHERGHEIGSHSVSHPILPLLSDAELKAEIAGSRTYLRQKLGADVDTFCYPNGDHDARVVAAVREAGYRYAVTTQYGINTRNHDPLTLKRCDMQAKHARTASGTFSPGRVLVRMSGLLPRAS